MKSHEHWYKNQLGQWLSHSCYAIHPPKKVDFKSYFMIASLFGFFTLAVHIVLKANGL